MYINRKNDTNICKIHTCVVDGTRLDYITFDGIEKTGIVKHMFTTRTGGVSKGEFGQMNLSFTRGDDPDCVLENYKRVSKIMDCDLNDIVCADQTHTTNIRVVTRKDCGKGVIRQKDYSDIDGLITDVSGIVLATFFADCVPLFVVDPVHHAIGMSHSGWRGTVKRMGQATLKAMKDNYGTNPKDVHVAIGPSICQKCYEVSQDVALAFKETFLTDDERLMYKKENGKYQLNLQYANRLVFIDAGVLEENIEETDLCTCCNPDFFHSHRASNGRRGNLGAFMKLT